MTTVVLGADGTLTPGEIRQKLYCVGTSGLKSVLTPDYACDNECVENMTANAARAWMYNQCAPTRLHSHCDYMSRCADRIRRMGHSLDDMRYLLFRRPHLCDQRGYLCVPTTATATINVECDNDGSDASLSSSSSSSSVSSLSSDGGCFAEYAADVADDVKLMLVSFVEDIDLVSVVASHNLDVCSSRPVYPLYVASIGDTQCNSISSWIERQFTRAVELVPILDTNISLETSSGRRFGLYGGIDKSVNEIPLCGTAVVQVIDVKPTHVPSSGQLSYVCKQVKSVATSTYNFLREGRGSIPSVVGYSRALPGTTPYVLSLTSNLDDSDSDSDDDGDDLDAHLEVVVSKTGEVKKLLFVNTVTTSNISTTPVQSLVDGTITLVADTTKAVVPTPGPILVESPQIQENPREEEASHPPAQIFDVATQVTAIASEFRAFQNVETAQGYVVSRGTLAPINPTITKATTPVQTQWFNFSLLSIAAFIALDQVGVSPTADLSLFVLADLMSNATSLQPPSAKAKRGRDRLAEVETTLALKTIDPRNQDKYGALVSILERSRKAGVKFPSVYDLVTCNLHVVPSSLTYTSPTSDVSSSSTVKQILDSTPNLFSPDAITGSHTFAFAFMLLCSLFGHSCLIAEQVAKVVFGDAVSTNAAEKTITVPLNSLALGLDKFITPGVLARELAVRFGGVYSAKDQVPVAYTQAVHLATKPLFALPEQNTTSRSVRSGSPTTITTFSPYATQLGFGVVVQKFVTVGTQPGSSARQLVKTDYVIASEDTANQIMMLLVPESRLSIVIKGSISTSKYDRRGMFERMIDSIPSDFAIGQSAITTKLAIAEIQELTGNTMGKFLATDRTLVGITDLPVCVLKTTREVQDKLLRLLKDTKLVPLSGNICGKKHDHVKIKHKDDVWYIKEKGAHTIKKTALAWDDNNNTYYAVCGESPLLVSIETVCNELSVSALRSVVQYIPGVKHVDTNHYLSFDGRQWVLPHVYKNKVQTACVMNVAPVRAYLEGIAAPSAGSAEPYGVSAKPIHIRQLTEAVSKIPTPKTDGPNTVTFTDESNISQTYFGMDPNRTETITRDFLRTVCALDASI